MKCLATSFDKPGNEHAQGRKWSQVHLLQEKTKRVHGTAHKSLMAGSRKPATRATCAAPPIGEERDNSDSGSSSDSSSPGDGESAASGEEDALVEESMPEEERDPEAGMEGELRDMDSDEASGAEEDATSMTPVGGNKWVCVATMGGGLRGDRPVRARSPR